MNDPRSARNPGQAPRRRPAGQPQRTDRRPRPQAQPVSPEEQATLQQLQQKRRIEAEKKRRRMLARRNARIRQAILILLALLVGYFIGLQVGKASAAPAQDANPTEPPVVAAPPVTTAPAPLIDPDLPLDTFLTPEIPGDTVAPQILGVNPISLFVGGTVAYRSGILVTDDTDPAPQLSVDSSGVDLSRPGTYRVVYTATDLSGNASSLDTTVTVAQAPDSYVDEGKIKEKADKILAKILTDGMTTEQQINAIYDYIETHHYYVAKFDKTDYMQAAYIMMTENRGDCFGYYALARLFFERLEIPNLTVTRMPNEVRTTNHWWNMVSLDGGRTWYHYDSTPHLTYPTRTCIITDADLEAFNQLMPNYYYFDRNSYPATPAE